MINIGRWAILAVLGAAAVGCGGDDSSNGPAHDSGVVFGIDSGVYLLDKFSGTISEAEGGLFHENGTNLVEGMDKAVLNKYDNHPVVADDEDTDEDEEKLRSVIMLRHSVTYLNATLNEASFSLNEDDVDYGYDVTITDLDGNELWNFHSMLEWCLGLPDAMPHLELTKLEEEYTPPTTLPAAESFPSNEVGSDARISACQLPRISLFWIGRDMQAIEVEVQAKYDEYLDMLRDGECFTDDTETELKEGDTACDVIVSDKKPTITTLERDVLLNVLLQDELEDDDTSFKLVLDLSMNEFANTEPFVFDFDVETFDVSEL